MAKIYVSSTYSDLQQYRAAVAHALRELRHEVVAMEAYVATDQRPLERCLRDVADCDLYLGIFAWHYGYIPSENNPEQKSITELEYRHAAKLGIPPLIFLLDEQAAWPAVLMDSRADDDDRGRRIERLRSELSASRTISFFGSPEELARKASAAVQLQLRERRPEVRTDIDPEIPYRRFVEHMRRSAGATSAHQAHSRYMQLTVQQTQFTGGELNVLPTGSWTDLFQYPATVLLASEAGSGKTTLLLHEANRLAQQPTLGFDTEIPVYLPMTGFRSGDYRTLIEMAANYNAMNSRALEYAWRAGTPKICIMIDDADKPAARQESVSAIRQLLRRKAPEHSVVVAGRPGGWQEELKRTRRAFREFLLLPLSEQQTTEFLRRFARDELVRSLEQYIREDTRVGDMLRRPDVLSAWAQSARSSPSVDRHPSVGFIYRFYLAHILGAQDSSYDLERIKIPALAKLGYDLAIRDRPSFVLNDALYDEMAELLERLHQRYHRRRRVMPEDWTAEELLEEIAASPVLEAVGEGSRELRFSRKQFQDFFVATEIQHAGTSAENLASLVHSLGEGDAMDVLVMALGLEPKAHEFIDGLAAVRTDLAVRVWSEGRIAGMSAPSSIEREFTQRREQLRSRFETAGKDVDPIVSAEWWRHPDPRRRQETVHVWSQLDQASPSVLVEIAADAHPLVRGIIDYMFLHFGEDSWYDSSELMCSPLVLGPNRELVYHSNGGGEARIGNLTLLRAPVPSVINLEVVVDHLSFDPILVDSHLRFVPTPAVSIAARMFRQEGNPDWLSLSSLCYCIATTTIDLAARVKRYEQLQDLHQRLMTRATDFNVLGQVVSEDLGCSWPLLQDPAPPATLTQAQEDYVRLRRTYGGANRFRQRAISRATEAALAAEAADAKQTLIQLEQTVSRVEGTVLTLAVDQVHLTAPARDDEYYSSERARIAANQVADKVVGGRIGCVDIKTLNGTSSYLPIMLELDCDLVANSVEGGRVEGVRIHRLTDRHPNWEVHCKMVVQKLEGQFEGVIIEDHEPERRPDDPDIGARPLV